MQIQIPAINKDQIQVDLKEILSLLGTESGALETHTEELIGICLADCKRIMEPRAAFVRIPALEHSSDDLIAMEGVSFQTGKTIKRMLSGAEAYAVLIVSIGQGPESRARELLNRGEFLEAYITDLLASALVDSAADLVQEHIRRMAAEQGWLITNRYSPGYCSWNVSEQQKLFSLFPENACHITLTESSLMDPIKSISALIGMGPSVRFQEYTCEICSMKDCAFRKMG
jgi:hypothetical protein